ncbi:hypothetical protein KSP35_13075 [Aquihabitans sp. G128]|uniref:hypothetical protein n=1 Tax=Aquihabitans sp. G128 TaxID=2849779 RepID=UPI001C21E361|nr:hypothetical protein [Aquihabitans sp. G128]QXC59335.1 hypothetical protein KSP35_13075 [Aquihabitans sp. G128]
MPLPQLATSTDLGVRLGVEFTDDQLPRIEALLADASATVRAYAGRPFTLTANATFTARPCCGVLTLPDGPVVSVASVLDGDGNPVPFSWSSGRKVHVRTSAPVTATYNYGWAEIPGDVVAVVCQVAGRASGTNAAQGANSEEHLGAYGFTVGTIAAAGAVGLLPAEQATLDRYRTGRQPGTISTTPWFRPAQLDPESWA